MLFNPFVITLWFLIINAATYAAFGIDKARAVGGQWRISESNLLTLALVGGTPAALVARQAFRHKTRKQPFSTILLVIATIQAGLIVGMVWSVFER